MYPYKVFLGLTLYDILLCVGIIACFLLFGFLADRHKIKNSIQRFALLCGAGATVLGYGSAVLFQALYNIKSLGRFEINESTGATFYGGLIGGVAVFLALYFGVGYLYFEDRRQKREFFKIAECAVPGIVLAHSFGRVGCLTAGCCHGAKTDAWYGIEHFVQSGDTEQYVSAGKYVPTQLFEAIFLLLLFGFLLIRSIEKKGYCLPIYLCVYAVWRFAIEFVRDDYRGDTFVSALSPSQLIACVLFAVGIGLFFLERHVTKRITEREARAEAENEKAE